MTVRLVQTGQAGIMQKMKVGSCVSFCVETCIDNRKLPNREDAPGGAPRKGLDAKLHWQLTKQYRVPGQQLQGMSNDDAAALLTKLRSSE